jgi:hypothetical protein
MADIREVIKDIVPEQGRLKWGKPISSYKLTFDSQQAKFEPIYYWILDFIKDMGWKTEKITDNFTSSPGSAHFSEMGIKQTTMQKQAMETLASLNAVIKSVLNLIYDLKEFKIRLEHYDDYNSEDKNKKYQGTLSLKQIWMDNVDMKKGNGSINVLSGQAGFVTLRDLFFTINNIEELKDTEIVNEQTKRILTPRLSEFWKWVDYSHKELKKRVGIEKSYLKNQIETIKLYSAWMKPYLKAAEQLRQKGFDNDAALVNAFSTTMFELTLLSTKDIEERPEKFKDDKKFKDYELKRKYHPILIVGLKYRGHVSQRVTQRGDYDFVMGGRVDMTFDSYSLNEDELRIVKDKFSNEDVGDSISLSGDVAAEALKDLKEDLDYFLKDDKEEEKKEEEKKKKNDINPFAALFRGFRKKKKKKDRGEREKIMDMKDVKRDNFIEKIVRAEAAGEAADTLYTVYDIYKKAHGMASAPGPEGFVNADEAKLEEGKTKAVDVFKGLEGSFKHKED